MCKNSDLNVFQNIKLLADISNNWPKYLLKIYVYEILELCW